MNNNENNILFNDILERNYYQYFKKGEKSIEIFLNGICPSNCSYCYLKKYQKELFPNDLQNFNNILNNCELIINWYIKNNFNCKIEIFSGEWITTKLRQPVFDLLYTSFKNVEKYQKPKAICLPDNMNFISNNEIKEEVQNFIDKMKQIGIPIYISASIDGKECDKDRILYDDSFYIDCFNFLNKNNFLCHPMISSSNIYNWKKNYLWWVNNAPANITKNLMMLEVRDETWDTNSIAELIKFCDFLIDFKLKNYFHNNLKEFTKYIFQLPTSKIITNYSPEFIEIHSYFNNKDKITCGFSETLHIRAADLSLGLCHRLWYNNLILGKFHVDNSNNLIDVESYNVELLSVKAHFKRSCMPRCEKCMIEPICPGFCCGNSQENYGLFLIPTMEVCQMYRAKYAYLIKKYNDMGIFKLIEEDPTLFENNMGNEKKFLLDLKNIINKQI